MVIQEILGYLLGSCSKLIKRSMDNKLKKYDLTTSQWAVLKLLDIKNNLKQTEIASKLSGDKATTGEVILRLYDKKYIERISNEKDKREYSVSLTPKAKDIITDMESMAKEVTDKALEGLEEQDVKILYKCLHQIIYNLTNERTL